MLRSSMFGSTFLAATFLVACSAGSVGTKDPFDDGSGAPSSSSNGTPTGSGTGTGAVTPAKPSAAVDLTGISKVTLSDGNCGGAPGYCYGQDSIEVDFSSSTIVRRKCVEKGTDPSSGQRLPTESTSTSKSLSSADAKRVRDALATMRVSDEKSTAQDGHMSAVVITTSSGTQAYSPMATCNQSAFKTIVGGFEAVTAVLYGL